MNIVEMKVVFDPNSNDEGILHLGGQKISVCCLGLDENHVKEGRYEMVNIHNMPPETISAYGESVVVFIPVSGDAKLKFSTDSKPLTICSGDTDSNSRLYRCNNGIRMYGSDLKTLLYFVQHNQCTLEVAHKKNRIFKKLVTKNVSKFNGSQVKPINARGLKGFDVNEWDEVDYLLAWYFYMEMCDEFDSMDDDDWQEDLEPYGDDDISEEDADSYDQEDNFPEENYPEEPESEFFGTPTEVGMDDAPIINNPFESDEDTDTLQQDDPVVQDSGYSVSELEEMQTRPDVGDNEFPPSDDFSSSTSDDFSSDGDTDY